MKQPFDQVVADHGSTVLRVCRAVLGPTADADDAWSETFLAAMRAWPELPDSANVQAWLVTIARRRAIDIVRTAGRHAIPVGEVPEQVSTTGLPDVDGRALSDAVKDLPDKQRHAVAYHYLGGLPYQEIAGILGGTTDAARRAAADGIRGLRRAYRAAHGKEASQ
jgi:RNA polymerase sigma factor (sigma-70 family)